MKSKEQIKKELVRIKDHPAFKSGDLSDGTKEEVFGMIHALEWVLKD